MRCVLECLPQTYRHLLSWWFSCCKRSSNMELREESTYSNLPFHQPQTTDQCSLNDLYYVVPDPLPVESPNSNKGRKFLKNKSKKMSKICEERIDSNGLEEEEEEDGIQEKIRGRFGRERCMSVPFISLKPKYQGRGTVDGLQLGAGARSSHHDRRESFLYRIQDPELQQDEERPVEDQIVTPFAQILASLKEVRSSLVSLSQDQSSVRHMVSGQESGLGGRRRLAEDALEELDWCLDQLESMETHKSVAEMAAIKFKLMLNRELTLLSETRDGKMISDHIRDVYYDHVYDHEFDETETTATKQKTGIRVLDAAGKTSVIQTVKAQRRVLVSQPTAVLEQSLYGVETDRLKELEKVMCLIPVWGLDVFTAASVIKNQRVLTCTTFRIFMERDLMKTFQIPVKTLLCFLMSLEDQYLKDVQYHNHLHAADVTQSTHVLLNSTPLKEVFTPLEVLAALLASAIHDVDHPGTTNQYLVATSSPLAVTYNDQSVLENHHLAVAFRLLQVTECDILAGLSNKQRTSLRKMVIDMVLATDMSKHMSLLADLKTMVETKKVAGSGVLLLDNYSDRIMVLQNMIHCCDLSNPTKPLELYVQWVDRLMEESFKQGDQERELGMELSPLCDRNTVNVAKCQVGFISYIVHPLWETMAELLYPDLQEIMATLESNRKYYEELEKTLVGGGGKV